MQPIRSIVLATDFSPLSEAAAARAAMLARLEGASIHLVHVVRFPIVVAPSEVSVPAAVLEAARRTAREELEARRKALEERGVANVTTEIPETGDPAAAIAEAAAARAADLVVMGTHGHGGLRRAFLGSVTERTLRRVERPVLAVKEDAARAAEPIARILLAVDFSVHSDRAAEAAAGLARRLAASVDVLHAVQLPRDDVPYASEAATALDEGIQTAAAEKLEGVGERLKQAGGTVTLHSRRGRPSQVIAEAARELRSQLVVLGTRGASGLAHALLGSVAERTLRTAPCSVLVVKAPAREDG